MANSVGRFYNATLGNSQFGSDGEHTLFTTNSSTTRIIKEMKFTPQTGVSFDGGYLEVNGHNVASLDASGTSLTGEFIVPPSSTVKLKLPNTYPVSFYKEYEQFGGTTGTPKLYVNVLVRDQSTGTVSHSLSQNRSGPNSPSSNVIDILDGRTSTIRSGSPTDASGTFYGPFYHMNAIVHDSNSVQQIHNFRALDWGEGPVGGGYPVSYGTQRVSGNYKGWAFDREITRGQYTSNASHGNQRVHNVIDNTSNNIQVYGTLNWEETTLQQFTRWNGVANSSPATPQGSFSPHVTSSWPRAHCIGDWYFTIPQSGYSTNGYGVSLKTGQWFQFNFNSGWQTSGNYDFTVSIDTDNDKFVFWRPTSNTNLARATTSRTITELESLTPGSQVTENCSHQNVSFPSGNLNVSSFGACQLSDRMDGGFGYQNTNRQLVSCSYDGSVLYTQSTFNGHDTLTPDRDVLWKYTMGRMTASEISAAGISQPTFQVQAFGYTAN